MSLVTVNEIKSISFSKTRQPVRITKRVMSRILRKQNENIQTMILSWKEKNPEKYEKYKNVSVEYLICGKCHKIIHDGEMVMKRHSVTEATRSVTIAQLIAPIYQHEACYIKGVY